MKKTSIQNYNVTKIGTVLISILNGTPFIITGGSKGSSSGPAHLASMLHGWNYTGEQVMIKDYHNITDDELNQLCGGSLERFRKAKSDDVEISCIELNDLRIRENVIIDQKQHVENIMQDQKENPDNAKRTAESIKEKLNELADEDSKGINTIFLISKERSAVLLERIETLSNPIFEEANKNFIASMASANSTVKYTVRLHPIAAHFRTYDPDEYAFAMFVIGQKFALQMKNIKEFAASEEVKALKVIAKKIHGMS